MHPRATTTRETFSWQWPCGTACKMERQVTISCPPHGCRCRHGIIAPPPPAGAGHHPPPPSPHHHHHHHHVRHHHHHQPQPEVTRALPVEEESSNSSSQHAPTTNHPPPPPPASATAAPVVVPAAEFWVPDPHLMVQQLREFESLHDEAVALRVQLEEYGEEIERSKRDTAAGGGRNWFLALPENARSVLVMARDAIDAYIAVSTPPPK